MPTTEEVEVHNATHVPFRSWCAFCVAGKAKANPHFIKEKNKVQSENVASLDYAFIGDKAGEESDADDEAEETGPDKVEYRDSKVI